MEMTLDVKHICPLQLEVIRRCELMFTNPGEIVFSPFGGIGSEGFVALGGKSPKTGNYIQNERRFYGCELKPEYHGEALTNMERAIAMRKERSRSLFDLLAADAKVELFGEPLADANDEYLEEAKS